MNLLEKMIKEHFSLTTVAIEHLRSSASYQIALDMALHQRWDALEALLRQIQIITNRVDMRHTKNEER